MGICPVAFGKVTGSLPLGVVLPNKISASALPPIVPGCQAYNTASDRFSSSLIINGRPAKGKEKSLDEIPLNAKQSVLGHSSYYLDLGAQPLFPFGYGLSYTSFEYSDLKTDHTVLTPNDTLSISVKVKNTGQYKGTEVVQLYVSDLFGSVTRPVKELKGFKRIELSPNEEKIVVFELSSYELSFWNINMKKEVEPGKFKIRIGTDSQSGLETFFEIK